MGNQQILASSPMKIEAVKQEGELKGCPFSQVWFYTEETGVGATDEE